MHLVEVTGTQSGLPLDPKAPGAAELGKRGRLGRLQSKQTRQASLVGLKRPQHIV